MLKLNCRTSRQIFDEICDDIHQGQYTSAYQAADTCDIPEHTIRRRYQAKYGVLLPTKKQFITDHVAVGLHDGTYKNIVEAANHFRLPEHIIRMYYFKKYNIWLPTGKQTQITQACNDLHDGKYTTMQQAVDHTGLTSTAIKTHYQSIYNQPWTRPPSPKYKTSLKKQQIIKVCNNMYNWEYKNLQQAVKDT